MKRNRTRDTTSLGTDAIERILLLCEVKGNDCPHKERTQPHDRMTKDRFLNEPFSVPISCVYKRHAKENKMLFIFALHTVYTTYYSGKSAV